jgi:hypothetical protein
MKSGIELIAEERKRQIEKEGWSHDHDDTHSNGELQQAAKVYETPPAKRKFKNDKYKPKGWPWHRAWYKPDILNRQRELIKAGALYQAEKDRIDRIIQKIASQIDGLNETGAGKGGDNE